MKHKILVKKIFKEVINPGNCFHCGLCEGLSKNLFKMTYSSKGPQPKLIRKPHVNDTQDLKKIVLACPGRGVPYNYLSKKIKTSNRNRLIGNYESLFISSSKENEIRRKASSGGIIRTLLTELIKSKKIDYVCILDQKKEKILSFDTLVTNSIQKILNSSQSIYQTTPILHKLNRLKTNRKYAFVGLSEHIASLRILKNMYPKKFNHIKYLIGIYTGTNMYPGAINFYLKGNGISDLSEVRKINWRFGEWPGKLRIKTKHNRILSLEKFYYNYLIPFFISKNSLITPDFTAELSDISIGDAWSPNLENKGYGYSVVITRLKEFDNILKRLSLKKKNDLNQISQSKAVSMHAHMIEFKKIGSFLRLEKLKKNGPIPLYDLKPERISFSRKIVENFIGLVILICSKNLIKKLFSNINSNFLGFVFKILRQFWKRISKPTKRKGLNNIKFTSISNSRLKEFF